MARDFELADTKTTLSSFRTRTAMSTALAVMASILLSCSVTFAVTPTTNSKSIADATDPKKKSKPAATSKIDPKLEKTALALVDAHLPELSDLLGRLKKDSPRQYDLAIRDMAKSARRLDSARNRDEELFEIEVEILKAQSSVKLLVAKLKVRDKTSERELLRKAISRMHRAEVAKAEYNVRFYEDRVKKAQQLAETAKKRLKSIQDAGDSRLEKSYAAFLRDAGRQDKRNSKSSKSKSPSNKSK